MKIQPISNYLIIKLDPADENIGNSKLIAPGQLNEAYNVPKRMAPSVRLAAASSLPAARSFLRS